MTGKAGKEGGSYHETAPLSCAPPLPSQSSSPTREVVQMLEEMTGWVEETSRLEAVGWSPSLSPTRHLVQMAAEARPSALGEEPA